MRNHLQIKLFAVLCLLAGSAFAQGYIGGLGTEPVKAAKAAVSVSGALPPAVKVSGNFLTDKNGMTLYTFDKDTAGKSACLGDCAVSWPPLLASDAAKDTGDFTLVVRNDGRRQWAFKGKPLYLWAGDTKAGDATGEGVGGVWHTAR